ncbi:MAG: carbohydrate ABC transporter permease [Candidatus Limiplasma sp.]|nr:carbohydrate ABC transporter permease [Candidatus Limiplasma sp.]
MKKRRLGSLLGLTLCALAVWIPLYLLLTGTLMSTGELNERIGMTLTGGDGYASWPLLPRWPTLKPLVHLLMDTPNFFPMFWNACLITIPTVLGQMVIASPAAWGLARGGFRGRKAVYLLYVALMLMPFQVLMVPSYLTLDKIGLLGTRWSVVFPSMFSTFPVFILYRFFAAIPETYVEAAELDGANRLQVFTRIGLPMGMPGILAILVLGFIESWNALEQPLTFIKDSSQWPVSLFLSNIATEDAGSAFAASLITMLPVVLIFLWGKPYLEAGIRAGGVKE